MVKSCPVCGAGEPILFLKRENVPVHQNLLMDSYETARSIERGILEMRVCPDCGFVFNTAFEPEKLQYGDQYDNNQACSSVFQEHLDTLVQYLLKEKGVKNCNIVEVGCGQGQFIRRLIEEGEGNTGFGFDPSYSGPDQVLNGRLQFRRSYYDETCTDILADVVICRHVIEHVPRPLDLLRSVRQALGGSKNARVFFETPCVEWILKNNVIWDFFYEHCSLFSTESIHAAFARSAYSVRSVRHVFNQQYLWLEADLSEARVSADYQTDKIIDLADKYRNSELDVLDAWTKKIHHARISGNVGLWGAGAKGVTFANMIDPDCQLLSCVVDLNPNKQGRHIAGTGHEIISYHELAEKQVKTLVLMNPNYFDENERLLNSNGLDVNLIV